MNVFILTDVEGIAGVDSIDYMDRHGELYKIAQKNLCHSINLSVDTLIKNGVDKVYYLDGHGGGGNVIEGMVDSRAIKCTVGEWCELLKLGEIDCQIEIGAHARAGTIGGFLDHTISSKTNFSISFGGVEMSEFSIHAILCAAYNVPIIAVVGDEAACNQAKEYVPDIYVGAVKRADERNVATTFSDADDILVSTIENALINRDKVSMISYSVPSELETVYYRTDMCESALKKATGNVVRKDARTLTKTIDKITNYTDFRMI